MIDRPHAPAAMGCPGLFHIVGARDGGLCRIKLPRGVLSATQAAALAQASQRHATGLIDITNRANLQVRGVRAGEEDALIGALLAAGLGPLVTPDDDAATAAARDDRRNVMISPTAGIDAQARTDTRPLADRLLYEMQATFRFHALSPKFAVLIDGGEALAERDHPHDIWLAALDGRHFAFGLAGVPGVALGILDQADAVAGVLALMHAFLDLATADMRRMRELVAVAGSAAILEQARRHGARLGSMHASASPRPREGSGTALRLGIHPQRDETLRYVGFQPPLNRMDASLLERLATLARETGNGHLHMTPWQSALLPDVASEHAADALAQLREWGMLVDPAQALTRVMACAGSTGCAKSPADTKADAVQLAQYGIPAGGVHLSGCVRSCASATVAAHTLLAVAPGRYDLYRREALPGFGRRLASHLTLHEAAAALRGDSQDIV